MIKGAKVYIGARSLPKAESAIVELRRLTPSVPVENLRPLVMDLNDLKEVQRVARGFVTSESRLDILVNNAVLYVPSTSHGHWQARTAMSMRD